MRISLCILLTTMGLCFSLDASNRVDYKKVSEELSLSANGKTQVVKSFPENFPELLTERGQPLVCTRENSENFEYIGMPIGGIGAGMLYLGGDGQLWFWDIFNLNSKKDDIKGEEAYEFPYHRSKTSEPGISQIDQGFSISVDKGKPIPLNRVGFENIQFLGQYPIGEVSYKDSNCPIQVNLEAFSPFAPLDIENSILPATVLRFTLENTSAKEVSVELSGWLENAVLAESKRTQACVSGSMLKNRFEKLPNNGLRLKTFVFPASASQREALRELPDFGTMTLSLLGEDAVITHTGDEIQALELPNEDKLVGKLSFNRNLAANSKTEAVFILTWHFKNTQIHYNKWRTPKSKKAFDRKATHYYASKFRNASEVSDYLINNLNLLTDHTRLWRETWYDSTLPYWFLDRTFLNTSILASCTSKILDGFVFHGTEGSYQGPGTCNHVWGYASAMGRLFPSLEVSLRENVDFLMEEDGGAMMENGAIRFRWLSEYDMAVDGQSGIILRTFATHQMSPNNSFLKRNYRGMKKAMQGLTAVNDPDHDGILTGAQHNTLDAPWYGKVTWLSLHYTAALRAAGKMAEEMEDFEYAKFCFETADKGRKYIEEHLFNGEYFIHEASLEHPNSPGTYTGLEYSQLLGQSWAYQVGLGTILDEHKVKKALESMWRYNFSTDVGPFREAHPEGRWYAMPGEGGLIACTWPRGGSEALSKGNARFAAYNNECQNGYEYAASSLMMWHGMSFHSLAHTWYMHNDRYHGSKRNPWAEVEWGFHYSRSMASYGSFLAASGFEYHGPKKHLGFAPNVTPHSFRSAMVTAEGWGSFEQSRTPNAQSNRIEIKFGSLEVETISFEIPQAKHVSEVILSKSGESLNCGFKQIDNRVEISLMKNLEIGKNQFLEAIIKY